MTKAPRSRRIAFGVTSHISAYAFLVGQLKYFSAHGWDVHLIVGSDDPGLQDFARSQAVTVHVLPTSRNPGPSDLLFIVRLARLLRSISPTITVMGTPKMGVFGTVSAAIARVPIRIYLVHGLRWDGLAGFMHRLIRGLDRLACNAATDVVAVSPSLEQRLLDEEVASAAKVRVLGHGSANGVDLERFRPLDHDAQQALRKAFDIPTSARVVTFVGRLTRDKGIEDLPSIWAAVVSRVPEAWLLVVGNSEPGESVDGLNHVRRVTIRPHTHEVEKVFQLADLNLFLSKREGLGMVPLEAAACGVTTVAFAVTGVIDAVEDGVTGRLVDLGDDAQMIADISEFLTTPEELSRLGDLARDHVAERYDSEDVWERWQVFFESRYHNLIAIGRTAN